MKIFPQPATSTIERKNDVSARLLFFFVVRKTEREADLREL
jgi:hypothetical protein